MADTRLTASFTGQPNEDGDDGVTVASAGPHANHLLLSPHCRQITMPAARHSVFYRPDTLLTPNRQCQSTEGN